MGYRKRISDALENTSYSSILKGIAVTTAKTAVNIVTSPSKLSQASFLLATNAIKSMADNSTFSHYVEQPILVAVNGSENLVAATFRYCIHAFQLRPTFGGLIVPPEIQSMFWQQDCAILDPNNGTGIAYNYLNGTAITECQGHIDATGIFLNEKIYCPHIELWQNISDCFEQLGYDMCNEMARLQSEESWRTTVFGGLVSSAAVFSILGASGVAFFLWKRHKRQKNQYDSFDNNELSDQNSPTDDSSIKGSEVRDEQTGENTRLVSNAT